MTLKIFLFGLFIFLIAFTSCTDDSKDEINCELKIKIIDNLDNNLLETGFYNSDTIFLFQDTYETKSYFDIESAESILSMATRILNTFNPDHEIFLYLNHFDTDTLEITYEIDPAIQCLGGFNLKTIKHNGQELIKKGDTYIIEK